MTGNLDMNNNRIYNLLTPTGPKQPTPLAFTDLEYLHVTGTNSMSNNLNMNNKSIIFLRDPTNITDGANKRYVDNTLLLNNIAMQNYLKKDGTVTMTGNLNLGSKKIVDLASPTTNTDATTKKYVDDSLVPYFKKDGSQKITGAIDINNNRIYNMPMPNGNNQPVTVIYANSNYLRINGNIPMMGNLNMNNRKIYNISTPTNNNDAATKKYVDDNSGSPDLSDYLEKDGSVPMTGNLNINNKKIINLSNPTQNNDAVNKDYVDKLVHHTAVQPSHYNDQFAYLMSSGSQWTDESNGGNSFLVDKIDVLTPANGNFHNYNHKVIYCKINKNSQGGYNYKMGINFYRHTANKDYTLCIELLNTEYLLWHKSQISVDKGNSSGLSIGNVSIKKLSHMYTDSGDQTQFMYYYRIIINFRKLSTGNRFILHISVNIPQSGIDLRSYPNQFKGAYMIAYGIVGTFSNIDPDKVYDYHTAFDIKPTEVVYNVDINANNKKIININLDRNSKNSAATVGMMEKIEPFSISYIYRKYFEEFFDFSDSKCYVLNRSTSGVVFNAISSISGNVARNITFPDKTIDNINYGSLTVYGYTLSFTPEIKQTSYTLCIIFSLWKNRNWSISKYDVSNVNRKTLLLNLYYLNSNGNLYLNIGNKTESLNIPNHVNGKKVVLWLTESINNTVTKVNLSNYSAELIVNKVSYSSNQKFEFLNASTEIYKFMYSPNFYDTHSVEHHTILLQEKLNGNYVD